jgi:hypothetical protein
MKRTSEIFGHVRLGVGLSLIWRDRTRHGVRQHRGVRAMFLLIIGRRRLSQTVGRGMSSVKPYAAQSLARVVDIKGGCVCVFAGKERLARHAPEEAPPPRRSRYTVG